MIRAQLTSINELCYWLQGAIEIGQLTTYTPEQAAIMKERLMSFCGHDDFSFRLLLTLTFFHPDVAFPLIRDRLAARFRHDIDPTYEGDQEILMGIHQGTGNV